MMLLPFLLLLSSLLCSFLPLLFLFLKTQKDMVVAVNVLRRHDQQHQNDWRMHLEKRWAGLRGAGGGCGR